MNRVNFFFLGQRDDPGNIKIRFHRTSTCADLVRFIGFEAMQGEAVFLRIDSHSTQTELIGRAKDADSDLAAVGSEQLANGPGFLHLSGVRPLTKLYIVA